MNPMIDMSDPCAWTQNMEQLCGGDCEGGEKAWCNKYNNDRKKCENAFVRRNTGEFGRCESSGSECFVSEASTGCYNPQHDLGNMDYMDVPYEPSEPNEPNESMFWD